MPNLHPLFYTFCQKHIDCVFASGENGSTPFPIHLTLYNLITVSECSNSHKHDDYKKGEHKGYHKDEHKDHHKHHKSHGKHRGGHKSQYNKGTLNNIFYLQKKEGLSVTSMLKLNIKVLLTYFYSCFLLFLAPAEQCLILT